MHPSGMPWRLILVVHFVAGPRVFDVVRNIAAGAEADQVRIIRRGTDGNRLGCSAIQIAQVVSYLLKLIGTELFIVLDLVQNDRVVGWLCLIRGQRISNETELGSNAECYSQYRSKVHVLLERNPILEA